MFLRNLVCNTFNLVEPNRRGILARAQAEPKIERITSGPRLSLVIFRQTILHEPYVTVVFPTCGFLRPFPWHHMARERNIWLSIEQK